MEKKFRLPKEFATRWVAALRSGEYKQGNGTLRMLYDDGNHYCCLGVAIKMNGVDDKNIFGGYPNIESNAEILAAVPLELLMGSTGDGSLGAECVDLNDIENKSFPEIADWLEQNVEFYEN